MKLGGFEREEKKISSSQLEHLQDFAKQGMVYEVTSQLADERLSPEVGLREGVSILTTALSRSYARTAKESQEREITPEAQARAGEYANIVLVLKNLLARS